MDHTEKKILKPKNEFKDLFCNTGFKNLSVKINLKEDTNTAQEKGRPIPIHIQDQVAEESRKNQKTNKKWLLGKSNRNNRRLLCEPSSDYVIETNQ